MRKIISWIAVVLWMILIFNLSSQPGTQSGKLSTGIAEVNIKAIEKVKPQAKFNIKKYEYILRKNAHFFVYLILGILLMNALRINDVVRYKSLTLLICVLYAASDEFHQMFAPGRSPRVLDVFIDSAGAILGILIRMPWHSQATPGQVKLREEK